MNNVTVEVDGTRFTGWKRVTVTKSLDNMCGTFSFTASAVVGKPFPIQQRTQCKIIINDVSVINGWVEKISVQLESDEHEVTISGRDRTNDVIDSQLSQKIEFNPPITLTQLVEKVLSELHLDDIKVIDNHNLKTFKDIAAESVGITAFDFIEKYAKKAAVMLTTDGFGNIVFQRSTLDLLNTVLSTKRDARGQILNSSVVYDDTKRFNFYNVSSSKSAASLHVFDKESSPKQMAHVTGSATDSEIRNSRIYYFQSDDTQEDTQTADRAKWEANFRKSNARVYTCTVQGFTPTDDQDKIWQPNYLVHVIDEFADVNAQLLIVEVTYTQSLDEGSKATLKLMQKESFTLQVETPIKDKKANNYGKNTFGAG